MNRGLKLNLYSELDEDVHLLINYSLFSMGDFRDPLMNGSSIGMTFQSQCKVVKDITRLSEESSVPI